jgi:hypothetical protein
MSAKKRREFLARDDVRLAVVVVALAAFGMEIVAALIWVGLMLWQREFRRRLSDWYQRWVLTGLVAVVFLKYPISTILNVPPSWVALVLAAVGAWVGLRFQPKRRPHQWR